MKKKKYRELQKLREKDLQNNDKFIKKIRKEVIKKDPIASEMKIKSVRGKKK